MIAKFITLVGLIIAAAAAATPAGAVKKSSGGVTCSSTGTERRDGKDQDGNKVNCLFDYCTYTQCSTSGGTIGNCVRKTEYSNARDCKAAARTGPGARVPTLRNAPKLKRMQ